MAIRTPHRYGTRAPAASLDPRLVGFGVTAMVLGAYAALQLFMTRSSVNFLWWRTELAREQDHFRYPKAPVPAAALQPTWQEWVPTATTAVLVTTALALLAVLMVRSGRGLWLLLVALLPLVPVELAPGVWAPPLANSSAYALVFPPGAIQPDTFWAWMEATLQSFAIILPAFVIGRMLTNRPARVWGGDVVWRLAGPAVVGFGVVLWDLGEGLPVDRGAVSRTALLVTIGALVITGTRSRWAAVLGLAVLPAVAGGLVTWTTDVTGQALVVVDPTAWRWGGLALAGAAWVLVQPRVHAGLRWGWDSWRTALEGAEVKVAEVEVAEVEVAEVEVAEVEVAEVEVAEPVSRRRGRGAATPVGGRHRA